MTAALDLQPSSDDHPTEGRLLPGRVQGRSGDCFAVTLEDRQPTRGPTDVIAPLAASCLLVPEPGDRVLVALSPQPYLLAVLERSAQRPARVEFPGDATIVSRAGTLALAGREGVRVTAGKAIGLWSQSLSVRTGKAELVAETLGSAVQSLRANVQQLGVVTHTCEVVAERIAQRAARVYRFVSELDQLRAQHFDFRAEQSAQVKGETTVVTARQVAKIDGEQVHIG